LGLVVSVALVLEFFNCFSLGPQEVVGQHRQALLFFFHMAFFNNENNFPRREGKIMGPYLGDQKKSQ
jgi:hypothetical protein